MTNIRPTIVIDPPSEDTWFQWKWAVVDPDTEREVYNGFALNAADARSKANHYKSIITRSNNVH